MEIFFKIFILLQFFQCIFSRALKPSDFCLIQACDVNTCNKTCHGKYSYECSKGLCTIERYHCHSLKLWVSFFTQKGERKVNHIEMFMMMIKECPAAIQYKWNANDFCLNGLSCQKKIILPYRLISTKINMYQKTACKCPSKYRFRCVGNKYCARDARICDEPTRFNQSRGAVKSCSNDHALIE